MKKLLLSALASACLVLVAHAEVLVYDLSFNTAGTSVNYSFLEGGYLVVDASSNAVTSIVTETDPQTDILYYTTGLLTGTYSTLTEERSDQAYAVVNSISGSGGTTDSIAFQILGKIGNNVNVGAGKNQDVAKKLRGYLNASAAESTSTTNNITTITYGFAGTSKVAANYQSGLTRDANRGRMDSAATLGYLATILQNRGVNPQSSPSPSPSPTATPSPSPTATPTATPLPSATP